MSRCTTNSRRGGPTFRSASPAARRPALLREDRLAPLRTLRRDGHAVLRQNGSLERIAIGAHDRDGALRGTVEPLALPRDDERRSFPRRRAPHFPGLEVE